MSKINSILQANTIQSCAFKSLDSAVPAKPQHDEEFVINQRETNEGENFHGKSSSDSDDSESSSDNEEIEMDEVGKLIAFWWIIQSFVAFSFKYNIF
jgi:hypothetical protein